MAELEVKLRRGSRDQAWPKLITPSRAMGFNRTLTTRIERVAHVRSWGEQPVIDRRCEAVDHIPKSSETGFIEFETQWRRIRFVQEPKRGSNARIRKLLVYGARVDAELEVANIEVGKVRS